MNLNDIKYFLEVANKESLTKAAECLGVRQPSLSVAIKRIEQAVGTSLFFRFKTGVKLTPAGKVLQKHAQTLYQNWQSITDSCLNANHSVAGTITLGCHMSVANYHFPTAIFNLLKANKDLNIRVVHGLSREINEGVISLNIDLGIVVNPTAHPDLVIKKLYTDKVGFWVKKGEKCDQKNLTLLSDPKLKQTQYLIKELYKTDLIVERRIESENFEFLARAAREGVGVAVIPESVAQSPINNCLTQFQEKIFYLDEICLVYRHENRFIKAIAAILDAIKITH